MRAMQARGSGEAARLAKRGQRVAICVSRILLDGLQKKRETARSLENGRKKTVVPATEIADSES